MDCNILVPISIKIPSYHYRNSHLKDKMVPWPAYLIMEIPISGNTVFIFRQGPERYISLLRVDYPSNYKYWLLHIYQHIKWFQKHHVKVNTCNEWPLGTALDQLLTYSLNDFYIWLQIFLLIPCQYEHSNPNACQWIVSNELLKVRNVLFKLPGY